jgi:5-deoxy-glucuronate isomerase
VTRKNLKVSSETTSAELARCLVRGPNRAFPDGLTTIVRPDSPRNDPGNTGVDFSIHRLRRGARHSEVSPGETVLVLLAGDLQIDANGSTFNASRGSLFDEGPSTFHCGPGQLFELTAGASAAEFAMIRTPRKSPLPIRFTRSSEVDSEDRGAGLAQGACRRCVRTVFDYSSRPDSNLVVGEVVNYPGRWSSYPPHHHAQPEIYHYRFTERQGYGHAELGDAVFKVRHGDTVSIPGGLDHAQVSAPGYGMYYLWIVRHLPRRPYKGFEFTPAHTWLLDPAQQGWLPPIGTLT